jgi:putative protease
VRPRGHHLSLRDLDLSAHYPALLEAGVTSFKIEGRLKDRAYVANVVAWHRARLDEALAAAGLRRSSTGRSEPGFVPDPRKTFNRGATTAFLFGADPEALRPATPKVLGEEVGRVADVGPRTVDLQAAVPLHPGDGLCFFDESGELRGTQVERVRGTRVSLQRTDGLRPGTLVHRNRDHAFLAALARARPVRRIAVELALRDDGAGDLALVARDEDGFEVVVRRPGPFEPARDAASAAASIRRQLERTGASVFTCRAARVEVSRVPFLAVSAINALRREALAALSALREAGRPRPTGGSVPNQAAHPEPEADWTAGVLNAQAEAFLRRHGVTRVERTAEAGLDLRGRVVLTSRHCLGRTLGRCPGAAGREDAAPLFLVDDEGRRLGLVFDCERCELGLRLE